MRSFRNGLSGRSAFFSTASTSLRLRGAGAPGISSFAGCSGSVRRNVSRSRNFCGPSVLSRPSRMTGTGDCVNDSISPRHQGGFLAVVIAEKEAPGAVGPQHACQDTAVLQFDRVAEVVGVDGGARFANVLQDGDVIAVNQVRQVRADAPALPADHVTLRARGLVAVEDL